MATKGINAGQQIRDGTITQSLLAQALLDIISGKADSTTVSTLQGAVTQLQADLTAEASRATGVESGLNGRLSTVETTIANISAGANPDSRPSVWAAYDTLAAYTANQGSLSGKRVLVLTGGAGYTAVPGNTFSDIGSMSGNRLIKNDSTEVSGTSARIKFVNGSYQALTLTGTLNTAAPWSARLDHPGVVFMAPDGFDPATIAEVQVGDFEGSVGIYVDGVLKEQVDAGAQVPVEAHSATGRNAAYDDKIVYLLTNGNWQAVGDQVSASNGVQRVGNDIQAKLDPASQLGVGAGGLRLKDAAPGQVYVADASGVMRPVTLSGDVTVDDAGVLSFSTQRDADVQRQVAVMPANEAVGPTQNSYSFNTAGRPITSGGFVAVLLNGVIVRSGITLAFNNMIPTVTFNGYALTTDDRVEFLMDAAFGAFGG